MYICKTILACLIALGDPFDAAELTERDALYKMGLSTLPAYRDLDGSLTKAWMMAQREEPGDKELFRLTMHPAPAKNSMT